MAPAEGHPHWLLPPTQQRSPQGGLGQQVGDIQPPCTRDRHTVGTPSAHRAELRGVPAGGPSSWIWQDTKMKGAGAGQVLTKHVPKIQSAIGSSRNLEILVCCFYGKRTDKKQTTIPTLSPLELQSGKSAWSEDSTYWKIQNIF